MCILHNYMIQRRARDAQTFFTGTACSGQGPSDRMSYVLQYSLSLFFLDRDVGPAGVHLFFLSAQEITQ